MIVRIPETKLHILMVLVENFLGRSKVTRQEMQSLEGTLNFFCKAIRSSRAFIRRMYDSMCSCFKPLHHIRLSAGIKSDLKMWLLFLNSFNGITNFPESDWCHLNILEFFTDSAGSIDMGCGAYFQGRWFLSPMA